MGDSDSGLQERLESVGLPTPGSSVRWTPLLRYSILKSLAEGQFSVQEILVAYAMSEDELRSWGLALVEEGLQGLTMRALVRRKQEETSRAR